MARYRKQTSRSPSDDAEPGVDPCSQQPQTSQAGTTNVHPQQAAPNQEPPQTSEARPYPPEIDPVDEASIESFPASDPPGYGTSHA